MKWTTDKPTEPGWYPYKDGERESWMVLEVFYLRSRGELVFIIYNDIKSFSELPDDAQWAGPIEEPTL